MTPTAVVTRGGLELPSVAFSLLAQWHTTRLILQWPSPAPLALPVVSSYHRMS